MTLRVSGVTRVPTFVGQGVAFVAMSLTLISPVSGQTAQEKQICVVPGSADTAAIVNGERITVADIDAYLGVKLSRVRNEEYQLRARALDELIENKQIEAAARRAGTSKEQLLAQTGSVANTNDDIVAKQVYQALPQRFGNSSEADAIVEIKTALMRQRVTAARTRLLADGGKASVEKKLQPFRIDINTQTGVSEGPVEAPIQIVEFSDFQCPYCSRASSITRDLMKKYPGRVRTFFRHFPLTAIHKEATKAAEAASCAAEQQKFWEMHDRMFANQQALQPPALKQIARDLALDGPKFDLCLDSGRHARLWQEDMREGNLYGVSGTPTFFINGRMVLGAPTMETFDRLIAEELQLLARREQAGTKSQ
jgi:protein-disulfide isomerase